MPTPQNYRDTQIMTASPMQLILMLYAECIRSLKEAEKGFDVSGPDKIQVINNNILHAQDIITELSLSLDMEKGGDIASNLERLYDFMIHHLTEANVKKDKKYLTEVRELLSELRVTWETVAEKEPAGKRVLQPSATGNIVMAG